MAKITSTPRLRSGERLRASPNFAQCHAMDGRPYVAKEVEPYVQYWLSERYRLLLAAFSKRGGAAPSEAIAAYFRLSGKRGNARERRLLLKAIEDMLGAEVLIRARDDTSRYNAHMARDYLIHRPFPREIADFLIETAPLGERSRVLDLAGGPGSLALALARVSRNVSLMELSRGFLAAAKREAKRVNLPLETIHDSCNRFVHRDGLYDAITVSQALHWLDDVQICRGVVRNLAPDGSFFVIHAAMTLPDKHPLGYVLGDRSVLGHKAATPFPDQVSALNRRLTLLFEALDAPDVERIDQEQYRGRNPGRIVPAGITVFRQTRPIGLGFARAFLSPAHIAAVASSPRQFWRDLGARSEAVHPRELAATMDWAVLRFRRGGAPSGRAQTAIDPIAIGYHGPAQG